MPKTKTNRTADFGDILASLDQQGMTGNRTRPAQRVEPEEVIEPAGSVAPRRKPLFGLFRNFAFPWHNSFSSLMAGLGPRHRNAYATEAADSTPPPHAAFPAGGEAAAPDKEHPKAAKTESESIAAELGLHASLGMIDLKRIRRDFAKKNHPDRFEPSRRISAERRMSIANMLIDAQIRQSRMLR